MFAFFWTRLITTSPSIQQALFFQAIPERDTTIPCLKSRNPLLSEVFPCLFGQIPSSECLNLAEEARKRVAMEYPDDRCHEINPFLWTFELAHNLEKRPAYLRKDASWRQMLIQQPPVRSLSVTFVDITNTEGLSLSFAQYNIPGDGSTNEDNYDNDEENKNKNTYEIRMNVLYDLILCDHFHSWTSVRIIWRDEGLIEVGELIGRTRLRNILRRTSADMIVIDTQMFQCSRTLRHERPRDPEDRLRREIQFPYRDWGSPTGDIYNGPMYLGLEPGKQGTCRISGDYLGL